MVKAYINDVLLDWCIVGEKTFSSDVTTHNIDDNSKDSIASHINNNFMSFSLQGVLQGEDRFERWEKLFNYRKQKKLCELTYFELLDRLVITNISKVQNGIDAYDINISFTQIEYATLKRTEKPLGSMKTTVSKKKKTGKQGTTTKTVVNKKIGKKTVVNKKIGKKIGGNLEN